MLFQRGTWIDKDTRRMASTSQPLSPRLGSPRPWTWGLDFRCNPSISRVNKNHHDHLR